MDDNKLLLMLKEKFGNFIINAINEIALNSDLKGGLFVPFYPLSEQDFGGDFNYLFIEDLDTFNGLDSLEDLLNQYFESFDNGNRLVAYLDGKNLKNVKFYVSPSLFTLQEAKEYKDTCGMNHLIVSLYSQDKFKIQENGDISLIDH